MIDIHNHILPGIDDGSPDMAFSLLLCKGLTSLGFTHAIATPHIISDLYPNKEKDIVILGESLKLALKENNIPLSIGFGAEYLMDDTFLAKIKRKHDFLAFPNKAMLVEFPFASIPESINDYSFSIQIEGYEAVLAHPERYRYWHTDLKKYDSLKDLGFSFQLNALSLTGYYGQGEKETAEYLLKRGLIDYIGTDLHHERHLNALINYYQETGIQAIINKYNLKNKYFESI
jgi:tyrosine-protein phosphatase YwqE